MEDQSQTSLLQFLPIIFLSLLMAVSAHLLAKDKARNVTKWTILGAIPIVNFVCMWFFIGASNLRVERKIDELIARLDGQANGPGTQV